MPPQSGAAPPPQEGGVQPALAAHGFDAVRRDAAGAVSHQDRKPVRLWDLPSMTNRARTYWRSLEELAETPEFTAIVEREAPRFRDIVNALDRRRFLQLMAASMALGGLSGCGPEENVRQLVPYVEAPE